ncbi:glycosyltransferase [Ornithinimicrobium tianjinense]|uniref:glycosyltransferase n=1 Tax=Ornithinimicrobium tianjinense TaxID=1195761 RepID=UPI0016685AF4|nr:glycosyltransferase [Ornithinimicrobium tianjinense]
MAQPPVPPTRARVEDVTVIVLTHPDGHPLDDLLDDLAAQSLRPQRVLVAGLDPQGGEAAQVARHALRTRHRVPVILRPALAPTGEEAARGEASPGRVLEDARSALPVHPGHWLWVLHDDSRPEPGALAALAGAVRRASRVAVVGPKLVRLDDPRMLVGVGLHLTAGGRPVDPRAGDGALVDQGQLDQRQDVLGVPLTGALLRSDVLDEVGGVDRAFGDDGVDGLDVSWRSHLAGHRVVVATDAVVRQGDSGLGVRDPRLTRVRQRQVALARGSVLGSLGRRLGIVVTSVLAALVLLLVKRPHEAADELADLRAALSPARGWGARWRFRRRRSVRPSDLRGLFVPAAAGWRTTLDVLADALDPRARRGDERVARGPSGAESGPVSEEFAELGPGGDRRPRWSWPLAVALALATSLTLWQWQRPGLVGALSPRSSGVAGGELGPATTDAAGLWSSALDGWRGGGLGHSDLAEPWLLPAALVSRIVELAPGAAGSATAGVGVAWLLALALPLSVVTAYLALRRVTRRPALRAALALGWAGLGPLPVAVGEGRVGPVVVHVLAPLLVAGYAVAASRSGGARRTAATFATVLAVVLAAQWVPLVLVPSTLAAVLLVVVGPAAVRRRGAVLAVLPWLLLLPWLPALWSDPVRLLGGAGATVAAEGASDAPAWQLLLLRPGAEVDPATWGALPLWCAVTLWTAALGALLLGGSSRRRAVALVSGALLALTLALAAPRLVLGALPQGYADAGAGVSAWSGTPLSLSSAALLLAAGLLLDRVLDKDAAPARRLGRLRRPAAAALVAIVLGAGGVALLHTTLLTGVGTLQRAIDPLPAVAAEQARGPAAQRTLILQPATTTGSGTLALDVDLLGAEPEPARILRDRARDLAVAVPGSPQVVDAVAALAGQGTPEEAAARLRGLGAAYVLLRSDDSHPVASLVDGLPGLTRVSSPPEQVLWRVAQPQVARVAAVGPDGQALHRLPVVGAHAAARGTLESLPEGARLVVAEGDGWARHAAVEVDGERVDVAGDGTVALPAGTHEVEVDVRAGLAPWHLVALVLAAVTAFLALPFGRPETEVEEQA